MKKIFIVGAGPGNKNFILEQAKNVVRESDLVVIDKRLFDSFWIPGQVLFLESDFEKIFKKVERGLKEIEKVSFVVSGDPELFSLSNFIIKRFKQIAKIEIIPGISSVSYFYSKLQRSLNGIPVFSLHGRKFDLNNLNKLQESIILLDNRKSLNKLGSHFKNEDVTFILGENLSYDNEKITWGKPNDFIDYENENLAILSILKN